MTGAGYRDEYADTDDDEELDDAAVEALLRLQAKAVGKIVDNLRPTARALFRQLLPAFSPRTRKALAERRPQLLILRLPSERWLEAATNALEAALATISNGSAQVGQFGSASFPRTARLGALKVDLIMKDLYSQSVVCFVDGTDRVPEQLAAFTDFVTQVGPFTAEMLQGALALRYPDRPGEWPADVDPASVHPDTLDLVLRKASDSDEAIRLLRSFQAGGNLVAASGDHPRLEDLHGYGEAAEWGLRLVADLESFRCGRIGWADVDSGCLLVGPPGVGKTLFASALASSAGCAFFPTSYAAWQSSKTGHLGDLLKSMRAVFEEAGSQMPSIVFIDEIDTLQARGSGSLHDDWWRSVTNGLLECVDGTSRREGMVIIAACNDGTNLDPALVRSGRLDRRFTIQMPDETALVGMFRSHLGGAIPDDVVQPIATAMAGATSGADVVRICRDARRLARQADRPVTGADLLSVALPPETRPQAVLRRVAIHEAGHAVVHMLYGGMPAALSIVRNGASGGGVVFEIDEDAVEGLRGDIEALIVPILAGRVAEQIVLGSVSAGAGGADTSDLARATSWLVQLETRLGLGSRLSFGQQADGDNVEVRIRRLYAEALMLVSRHRQAVVALADLALERRVLGREALKHFAIMHIVQIA
ncbi:AAA family ATPase [Aureimonas glaciei]|uniref:AAA+ ATPase domain-containing protein n=1 Tax=Aureimonas glaciei TaxID=1776957 RepID=A0A917DB36_9HYPH|nr:AAA family ATPase [Aureimonas glaciei]GGD22242.1 hypothetical protein GCM10011335_26400 [Aureimonas glaciei]